MHRVLPSRPHVHIQFWCIKNDADADADMETNEFLYVVFFSPKNIAYGES